MKALLTGGCGFIGSHTAVTLLAAGHEVLCYDNLSNSSDEVLGSIRRITGKKPAFIRGDIRDRPKLTEALRDFAPDIVIHFAGLKAVGESVEKPLEYYDNNVGGTICLLKAMFEAGCRNLIFSSSASVYDSRFPSPYSEESPVGHATSPYAGTKIQIESILRDLASADPAWSIVSLRYFNPAGAHESGLIGENPAGIPNNLMPYVSQVACGKLPFVQVFGSDYPTPDGTGIRDYIHVMDVAEGHAAAVGYCLSHRGEAAVNLGAGRGVSVLELIAAYEKASGRRIAYRIAGRRPGDLALFYADPSLALRLFGWKARRSLGDMCRDSWNYARRRFGA